MSHTILIVDDSAFIRRSVRSCIEQNTEWEVCGEAENGKVAIEKVEQLHPDVVILDLQMTFMNGLEAARKIKRIAPASTILMFTLYRSEQLMQEAHPAGIKDVLSKSDRPAEHLITVLSDAWAGV
jgi:DNA-binding NarL/FixJ family response regulator